MIERTFLQTGAENATEAAGSSLARSLYQIPLTISFSGALGSGKTAFIRGFLRALGVEQPVTSPTYALEQRYNTPRGEVIHIDLYRLTPEEAVRTLRASDDHPGIRCIEWPERAGDAVQTDIRVAITETGPETRTISIECEDVDWPNDDTIDAWRQEVRLPANIGAHCDAVALFCERASDVLIAGGTFIRRQLVRSAARTHDLLRFVDFKLGAGPTDRVDSADDQAVWTALQQSLGAATHEEAGELFLRSHGFPALAAVVGAHTVHLPVSARQTTEQHLLYYADKRLIGDRFVSVAERYEDFAVRYAKGERSAESAQWEQDAYDTEKILFPDGAPL